MKTKLKVGTLIDGRYEILDFITAGGMGGIYKAQHIHIQRIVALKILDRVDFTQTEFRERFLLEARLVAQLSHPNLIEIHDFGFFGEENQPFLVMPFLSGRDLHQEIIKKGSLPLHRALSLMKKSLSGLAAVHAKGIIHKDIKPANLFITAPGTPEENVILLDFGVARAGETQLGMTQVGGIAGTPEYLAPEYISSQKITPALDVYAMALVLVEMLTGRPLVQCLNPMECLVKHATGQIEIPSMLLNSPLGNILERALKLKPEERYADAALFLEAIDAMVYELEGSPQTPEEQRRASRPKLPGVVPAPNPSPTTYPRPKPRVSSHSTPKPSNFYAFMGKEELVPQEISALQHLQTPSLASQVLPIPPKSHLSPKTRRVATLLTPKSIAPSFSSRPLTPSSPAIRTLAPPFPPTHPQTPARSTPVPSMPRRPAPSMSRRPAPSMSRRPAPSIPSGPALSMSRRPAPNMLRQPSPTGMLSLSQDPIFEGLFKRATLLYIQGAYEEALDTFYQCSERSPGNKQVLHNIEKLCKRLAPPGLFSQD